MILQCDINGTFLIISNILSVEIFIVRDKTSGCKSRKTDKKYTHKGLMQIILKL